MWCQCTGGGKRGYVRQSDSDLWVHSSCDLPSRMVFEVMTDRRAPKNARLILNAKGRIDGTWLITFRLLDGSKKTVMTYRPYPNKVDMETPRDLLVDMWQMLDASIAGIMGASNARDQEWHKFRARAQAEIIAKIMSPFYADADAVGHEGMTRWQAKQAGTEHESPGLAEEIWNPNTRFDGTMYAVGAKVPSSTKTAPKRTGNSIPEQALPTARQAIESGMFTYAQLAMTYKMTEAEVREQLGS